MVSLCNSLWGVCVHLLRVCVCVCGDAQMLLTVMRCVSLRETQSIKSSVFTHTVSLYRLNWAIRLFRNTCLLLCNWSISVRLHFSISRFGPNCIFFNHTHFPFALTFLFASHLWEWCFCDISLQSSCVLTFALCVIMFVLLTTLCIFWSTCAT